MPKIAGSPEVESANRRGLFRSKPCGTGVGLGIARRYCKKQLGPSDPLPPTERVGCGWGCACRRHMPANDSRKRKGKDGPDPDC